ncbi:hypothetical protein GCM10009737_18300 [Nocardioides lentus]|uniref:GH16 domain-containing protein n=1 Tax=Nocardioides lentus TaxID=338077 RepID=A0ABN2PCC1_9ACTN
MTSLHSPIPRRPRARLVPALLSGLVAALLPTVGLAAGPAASAAPTSTVPVSAGVAVAGLAGAPTADAERASYWRKVGTEPFNRLDTSRWGVFSGKPGCCADAEWSPSMAKVSNGQLKLHTAPRDGRWLSGGVGGWGWDTAVRQYGRWDARIKFDKGAGVSAAALLWPTGDSWPPELDFYEIFETWGQRDKMSVTTHYKGSRGEHLRSQKVVARDFSRWHVASVRWMPGRVAYFLDGRQIKVETQAARIPRGKMWVGFQTHAHKINGRYAALPEGRSSVALSVDWVKVYARNR